MCLACEMDALWYDEMDAAVLRARQERLEQARLEQAAAESTQAEQTEPTGSARRRPASGFVCEETGPE